MFGSKEKTVQISVRIDDALRRRFKSRVMASEGVDINSVLTKFVEAYADGKPEAEAIAMGQDLFSQSTYAARIDEMRRICDHEGIPLGKAINTALAMWIDFRSPHAEMVKIPQFLKNSVSWMQRRFRNEAQAATLEGLLQQLGEFAQLQAESAPPQGGHSTKADRAG